jgi:hypothetical protein
MELDVKVKITYVGSREAKSVKLIFQVTAQNLLPSLFGSKIHFICIYTSCHILYDS